MLFNTLPLMPPNCILPIDLGDSVITKSDGNPRIAS